MARDPLKKLLSLDDPGAGPARPIDAEAAQKHAALAGGGTVPRPKAELGAEYTMIDIPGPLRSFSRMAAMTWRPFCSAVTCAQPGARRSCGQPWLT